MIIMLIKWVMIIIVVEAITELIISGDIFLNLRNWLAKKSIFLHKLLSCGYCFSVWVAATIAWLAPGNVSENIIINIFVKIFVIHRLSNIIHELFQRLFDRTPISIVFNHINNEIEDKEIEVDDGQEQNVI